MEYAAILLLLKKRRRPRKTIDEGLKSVFPMVTAGAGNGDLNQPVQRPERKKVGRSLQTERVFRLQLLLDLAPGGVMFCVPLLTLFSQDNRGRGGERQWSDQSVASQHPGPV